MISFFMPMIPPTVTAQQHRVKKTRENYIFYDSPKLIAARQKLIGHLGKHRPEEPYQQAVRLIVKWLFPITGRHHDGEYKYTRPDTDNLNKLLKDCMTEVGFWKDDALVVSEIIEKFWAANPGIYIRIETLEEIDNYDDEIL